MTKEEISEKANDLTQEYIRTDEGSEVFYRTMQELKKYNKQFLVRALVVECLENETLVSMVKDKDDYGLK